MHAGTRNSTLLPLSVAVPTFGRHEVLTNTIQSLLDLNENPVEILVIDQTPEHNNVTTQKLIRWNDQGDIRWLKRARPSITESMNCAIQEAASPLVLFLDDDITPYPGLLTAHQHCHAEFPEIWASVGQVIQPWQQPEASEAPRKLTGLRQDFDFPFHSTLPAWVTNVMAGNLCVRRDKALQLGGFDENFIGSAYRFETDFARRVIAAGGRIRFQPHAGIQHLRISSGGTRTTGDHLRSANPAHGVGDYYYALQHGRSGQFCKYATWRIFREVSTRFHLRRPWWIPVKFLGELRAVLWAIQMSRRGPKLALPNDRTENP